LEIEIKTRNHGKDGNIFKKCSSFNFKRLHHSLILDLIIFHKVTAYDKLPNSHQQIHIRKNESDKDQLQNSKAVNIDPLL